jgi:triacylglycerol lipase
VRTLDDEIVQPTSGPDPTSALTGASNLVIQGICPGRVTNHIGTGVDSVAYAALRDAMTHCGPARASRIKRTVCRRPYAPGLDPERARAGIQASYALASPRTLHGAEGGVLLSREPAVRRWVRAR